MKKGRENSTRSFRFGVAFGAFSLLAAAGTSLGVNQITYQVVARAGTQAPGLPAGVNHSGFDLGFGGARMNSENWTGWRGFVTGTGVTGANDTIVWGGHPTALEIAAREGEQAAEMAAGVVYRDLELEQPPALGGSGNVAFLSLLTGPGITLGSNDRAIFAGMPGSLQVAARSGTWAPGTGQNFGGIGLPVINGVGTLAFTGSLADALTTGIWFGKIGSITTAILSGDAAPGMGPSVFWGPTFMSTATNPRVVINSAGQIAFLGTLWGAGIGAANNDLLVGGTPGSLHFVCRQGNFVNGSSGPTWGGAWEDITINDDGAVAYRAWLQGAGISGANDFVVVHQYILGVPTIVAQEGDPEGVPGMPLGTVWADLAGAAGNGSPRMNNANKVTFRAAVTGASINASNDTGVWAHNDIGALVMMAREGNQAVDLPAGTNYTGFFAEGPVINALGQIAFRATVTGGVTHLFASDPYGVMHRISGFEISPGVNCTPGSFALVGRGVEDGTSTSFADDGRMIVRGTCGGDAAIFVADVNNICKPEITDDPDPASVSPGSDVNLDVVATGPGVLLYSWYRDGELLADGPSGSGGGYLTGATTPNLTVHFAQPGDAGVYHCVVSNLCKAIPSANAEVSVAAACDDIDFNNDDIYPDTQDLLDFLSVFAGGPCSNDPNCGDIDFNNDDIYPDTLDLELFLSVFSGGSC